MFWNNSIMAYFTFLYSGSIIIIIIKQILSNGKPSRKGSEQTRLSVCFAFWASDLYSRCSRFYKYNYVAVDYIRINCRMHEWIIFEIAVLQLFWLQIILIAPQFFEARDDVE